MRQALEGDVAVWACGWQGHAKGLQWWDQAGQLPMMPLAGEPAKMLLGTSRRNLEELLCHHPSDLGKNQERRRAREANLNLTLNLALSTQHPVGFSFTPGGMLNRLSHVFPEERTLQGGCEHTYLPP